MQSKKYILLRDIWFNGRAMFTLLPYRINPKKYAEIQSRYGDILREYDDRPKRYVIIGDKKMTWGEYLKYKHSLRK